jgi:hypothetical protein
VNTGPIQITFSLASGLASYSWNKVGRMSDAYSAARLGTFLKSTDYSTHRFLSSDVRRLSDGFGRGVRLSFLNTEEGKPALRQSYYLYEGRPFFLLEITLESPTAISTNWLAPLQLDKPGSVNIGASADERVLIVPWDNDNFMRYRGEPIDSAGSSYEVTSIYHGIRRRILFGNSGHCSSWSRLRHFGHLASIFRRLLPGLACRHGAIRLGEQRHRSSSSLGW